MAEQLALEFDQIKNFGRQAMSFGLMDAKSFAEREGHAQLLAAIPSILEISEADKASDVTSVLFTESEDTLLAELPFANYAHFVTFFEDRVRLNPHEPPQDFDVFANRPLPEPMVRYCINDVLVLPMLYEHFLEHRFWNPAWAKRVHEASEARLEETRARRWRNGGPTQGHAPAGWAEVKQVDGTVG